MDKRSNRIFKPGNRYLIAYLTFLSAFPPLTTDMYLPALPELASNLGASNEMASYTLSMFFFVYSFSLLIWGPFSDKYGRRPVLIGGTLIYILASIGITLVANISQLLVLRCIQAIGCASASALSLAIVKDVLRGQIMEKIVSLMQAAHILAPLTAPVIGGILLYFLNWRGIFGILVICGILAFVGALMLSETAILQKETSILQTFGRIGHVIRHKIFAPRLLLFSLLAMPFFSFLAASTFIYQTQFFLTAQDFSMFFAFNAAFSLLGPLLHLYYFSKKNRTVVITWEILGIGAFGLMIILFGAHSPWIFALFMAPITFLGSAIRPPSTVLMMESLKGDNGIVSSLIQCGAMLCGSFAMYAATLSIWPSPVIAIGTISVLVSVLCLAGWLKIKPN